MGGIGPRSAGVIEGAIGTVRNVSGMACRRRREWDFSSREIHAVQQYSATVRSPVVRRGARSGM
jgi:hypothetical protein